MEAPAGRGTFEKLQKAIATHEENHYTKMVGGYTCQACGAKVQQTTCDVSVHSKRFDTCSGIGKILKIPLPYCPNCEKVPKRTSTCVHGLN